MIRRFAVILGILAVVVLAGCNTLPSSFSPPPGACNTLGAGDEIGWELYLVNEQ